MSDEIKPQDIPVPDGEDGDIKPLDSHISSEGEKGTVEPADSHISGGDDGDIKPLDSHIS
jgi:hypothetical protein